MEQVYNGMAGNLHISDPELFVDNQARRRSGHMSHAMLEYAPGKIIDFNSNCSAERLNGHAHSAILSTVILKTAVKHGMTFICCRVP